jgi:hypothetical protein
MADGRRRDEWERAACLMSVIGKAFGGKWVDPRKLNPYYREPPKTAEQERAESRRAFKILGQALKEVAGLG